MSPASIWTRAGTRSARGEQRDSHRENSVQPAADVRQALTVATLDLRGDPAVGVTHLAQRPVDLGVIDRVVRIADVNIKTPPWASLEVKLLAETLGIELEDALAERPDPVLRPAVADH